MISATLFPQQLVLLFFLTWKELCNLLSEKIGCKISLRGKIHFLNICTDMYRQGVLRGTD